MCQLIGAGIGLSIAQLLALKDEAGSVGFLGSPVLKDLVHRLAGAERRQTLVGLIQPFQHLQTFTEPLCMCRRVHSRTIGSKGFACNSLAALERDLPKGQRAS